MKKAISSGAAGLLVLLVTATAAWAALPRFSSHLIVPGRSIGGITLKSSLAAAERAAHGSRRHCSPLGCGFSATNGATTSFLVAKTSAHGKPFVARISIGVGYRVVKGAQRPHFNTPLTSLKTAKGIGLGSSAKAVRRAYPHVKGTTRKGLFTLAGPGQRSTEFTLSRGRVTAIVVQALSLG